MEQPFAPVPEGSVGSFRYDVGRDRWAWSPELFLRRGLDPVRDEPSTDRFLFRIQEEDQAAVKSAIETAARQVGSFSVRYRVNTPSNGLRSILLVGESVPHGDQESVVRGFDIDITGPLAESANDAVYASAQHRAAIEQVKGALMLTCDVDEDEAFAILRTWSQNLNEKLAHLAERVAHDLTATHLDHSQPRRALLQLFLPPDHAGSITGPTQLHQ